MTSVSSVVALVGSPIVKMMVSNTSTSSSSTAVIVTLAESDPAGITISDALTEYSSDEAVPDSVRGTVISNPETGSAVAVRVTESEPSDTVSDENAKVTDDGSLISVIVTEISELSDNVAFIGVPGVKIKVSSASSNVSSTPVKVIVPVVEPAGILISGES